MTASVLAPSRNAVSAAMGVSSPADYRGSEHSRQRKKLHQQKHYKQPTFGLSTAKPADKKISSSSALSSSKQHAKLHKRGVSSVSSASSMGSSPDGFRQSSTSPVFTNEGQRLVTSPLTVPVGETADATVTTNSLSVSAVAPSRIKPYLRKLSSKENTKNSNHTAKNSSKSAIGNTTIDLSRPAAENEGLAGLGITGYGIGARSAQDISISALGRQAIHTRSASNTSSQFSASSIAATSAVSGLHRPTAPYVHPMRQTPRPCTPPIQSAIQGLISESDLNGADCSGSGFELDSVSSHEILSEKGRRPSAPVSSTPTAGMVLSASSSQPARATAATPSIQPSTKLHLSTTASTLNQSQTSFLGSGTPQMRSRGNTLLSVDTMAASGTATTPSSRTSLDRALTSILGRDRVDSAAGNAINPPINPAEKRAAQIRAARQAYRAKEEAKARKTEKALLKKEEKNLKKRLKKEEMEQRSHKRSDTRTFGTGSEKLTGGAGGAYAGADISFGETGPVRNRNIDASTDAGLLSPSSSYPGARSRWLAFITWLRTRLLKISRKLHLS